MTVITMGVTPDGIMRRFLVRNAGSGIAIDFDEHKFCRVVSLLQHIETQDAQFQHAQAGVGARRGYERLDTVGFHMDMNVNNEHGREIG